MRNTRKLILLTDPPIQFALYVFPLGWLALFFVSLLKFNISCVAVFHPRVHTHGFS